MDELDKTPFIIGKLISSSATHPENAPSAMLVTLAGIVTLSSFEQSQKENAPIVLIVFGSITSTRFLHSQNEQEEFSKADSSSVSPVTSDKSNTTFISLLSLESCFNAVFISRNNLALKRPLALITRDSFKALISSTIPLPSSGPVACSVVSLVPLSVPVAPFAELPLALLQDKIKPLASKTAIKAKVKSFFIKTSKIKKKSL